MIEKQFDRYYSLIERVSFKQIFLFWILYMFIFGGIYFMLSFTSHSAVLYKGLPLTPDINGFLTAEYFSFITAASASQGYGDLLPIGIARVFAVIEAVSGLVIFGVIISKLLSQKQEVLLEEVYEISFEEKINRIRSTFSLFRADINKIMEKIDSNTITKRAVDDLWITFTTFENAMYNMTKLLKPSKNNRYVKPLDDLNLELVLNSISTSLAKSRDLISALNEHGLHWQNEMMGSILTAIPINVNSVKDSLKGRELNKKIVDKLNEIAYLSEQLKQQTHLTVTAA